MKGILKQSIWSAAFFLVVLAWIFGLFTDLTGDAGLYAAISRQMVEAGDWLNLKINGVPYDQKPHLIFWLSGVGIKWFGTTNFAFKIFSFLYALSALFFVYRLARLLYSEKAGRLAAIITGTSQLYFLYFLDIHTDTVLQAGVTLAVWQFAEYLAGRKTVHFIAGFFATGLAMLAKGPVGAVLPFLFVLFHLIKIKNFSGIRWNSHNFNPARLCQKSSWSFHLVIKKDFRLLFHFKWFFGIIIILAVISPSLYHLWKSFGPEGLRFYFIDNNLGRVTGEVAGSNSDPFYYLYNLLWAFLPWTVPVLVALFMEVRSWIHARPTGMPGFPLLGSVIVLLLIYSVSRGKAPNYLMITIPLISTVAAGRLEQVFTGPFPFKSLRQAIWPTETAGMINPVKSNPCHQVNKIIVLLHGFVLFLFFALLCISCFILSDTKAWLFASLAVPAVLLVAVFFKIESGGWKRLIFGSLILSAVFNLYFNIHVIPGLFRYQGARQALQIYEGCRGEKGLLKSLHLEEYELFYHAKTPVENFSDWENFYAFLKQAEPWVYTNQIGYPVVMQLAPQIDTVYVIRQRGMNEITLHFLWPPTRQSALNENYLIKIR